MSGFNYEHFSADFSKRTNCNLKLIERVVELRKRMADSDVLTPVAKSECYEVTQLLLSVYGMLLVPFEKYKNNPEKSKKDIINALSEDHNYTALERIIVDLQWDKRLKSTYDDKNDGRVYCFIHHLRNSIAHEGIHFYPLEAYDSGEIEEIMFCDFDSEGGSIKSFEAARKKFCTKVTVEKLRQIIDLIMNMYSNIGENFDIGDKARYKKEIQICESFLSGEAPGNRRLKK